MYKTGIVRDDLYILHDMGDYHPESPKRLISIYEMLDQPDMAGKFIQVPTRAATREEICWIHNKSYYSLIESTKGRSEYLDPDTSTSPKSFEAAATAVGGCLNALDMIFSGEINNAFALIRPPGHHAEANRSKGFCLFNNVAIAAEYARRKYGCKKVMIVDWDLHHGNGTQNSFYESNKVFYVSTHQYPYFPGSGDFSEFGWHDGEGFTLNIPMSVGYGDGDFMRLFDEIIVPAGMEYAPDLLIVSVGMDTYFADPLGGMKVTPKGYAAMTGAMMKLAEKCCEGRMLMALEGGYNLEGLTTSVKECLKTMQLEPENRPTETFEPEQPERLLSLIHKVVEIHSRYWTCLKK